ncbi:hypothetical protein ACSBR1_022509 [Camellia fascicularis]
MEKEDSLKDFVQRRRSTGEWMLSFRRSLLSWEEEEVGRLQGLLSNALVLRMNCPDFLQWEAVSSSQFTVASVRKECDAKYGPRLQITKMLWHNAAPPKAQFFGWLPWKGKVKTADFLYSIRVIRSSEGIVCPFCKSEAEIGNHVLLLCLGVWEVWSDLLWEISRVTPIDVEGLLRWRRGVKFKKIERQIWKTVPIALLWSIWKARRWQNYPTRLYLSRPDFNKKKFRRTLIK